MGSYSMADAGLPYGRPGSWAGDPVSVSPLSVWSVFDVFNSWQFLSLNLFINVRTILFVFCKCSNQDKFCKSPGVVQTSADREPKAYRSCARWRFFCSSTWRSLRAMRKTHALHCERRTRSWRRSSWRAMRSCPGSGRSSRPLAPQRRRASRKDVRSARPRHVGLRPMRACPRRIGGVKVTPPRKPRRRPCARCCSRLVGVGECCARSPV